MVSQTFRVLNQVNRSKKHFLIILPALFLLCTAGFQGFAGNSAGPSFIENKGQVVNQDNLPNKDVLYLCSGGNLRIQLRKTGFSYEIFDYGDAQQTAKSPLQHVYAGDIKDLTIKSHRVDIDLAGMNPAMWVETGTASEDVNNYYLNGKEIVGVRSFTRIIYKNVYNFTDIEFELNGNKTNSFKYNIVLRPGADISKIKMMLKGALRLQMNTDGGLSIVTSFGTVSENIPKSYYADNSANEVKVNYTLKNNEISFSGSYDNSRTLVIDPVSNLVWSTYFGGSSTEYCNGADVDGQNNVYFVGYTNSAANIATSGIYQSTLAAGFDAYIVKFNSAGSRLWGTYVGGPSTDNFYAVCVNAGGTTIYAAGDTFSQSNIASPGAYQTVYGGGIDDVMLAKFTANGQRMWSTYYGGPEHDICQAMTVDNAGDIIVTGHTQSTVGIATGGAYITSYNLNFDAFVAKFSPIGLRLWGTYYGDSGLDEAYGIAHDANDNIIVTGATQSFAGIATSSAHQPSLGGIQDAFIVKFNPAGNGVIWGTYLGGSGNDFGTDAEVDSQGNIFICGITTSNNNMVTANASQTVQGSSDDTFLNSFTSAGVRQWGTYFGGDDSDYITDLVIDSNQDLLFCGSTLSSYSISTPGAYQPSLAAIYFYDAYFAKFSNSGNKILATYFGSDNNEFGRAMTVDGLGKIYLAGESSSTANISTPGSYQPAYGGGADAFLAKFCIPFTPKLTPSGSPTICVGPATISAAQGFSTYLWNSTFTVNPLVVNTTTAIGTYTFALEVDDGVGCIGKSDTLVLTVQKCTGLEEYNDDLTVNAFPNPFEDNVSIDLSREGSSGFDIRIYSSTGVLVFEGRSEGPQYKVNLNPLPKGFYMLEVMSSDKMYLKKLLKN